MKKVLSSFVVLVVMILMVGTAQAGPIDTVFGWFGYTPTTEYELQVAKAEKAAVEATAAKASAKAALEAAESAEASATAVKGVGSLWLLTIGILGGFGYLRRRKIAEDIISADEKRKKEKAEKSA